MAKRYNIKWTDADNRELRKAVKNFNAKISRLEKKVDKRSLHALPERVTVKQMRELISTRNDLKRELNSLKRFSQKGAEEFVTLPDNEYNTTITKWERNEISRRTAVINRKRKARYEDVFNLPATSGGEELGYTVGQQIESIGMGSIAENELKEVSAFTPTMNRAGAHYRLNALRQEHQDAFWEKKEMVLRQNYINELMKDKFAYEDIADIVEHIENMDFTDFYKTFLQEGGTMEDLYPPKQGSPEYQSSVEHLRSIWIPNNKP